MQEEEGNWEEGEDVEVEEKDGGWRGGGGGRWRRKVEGGGGGRILVTSEAKIRCFAPSAGGSQIRGKCGRHNLGMSLDIVS